MDNILIYIGPLVGGLILYAIIHAVVRAPGSSLNSKFVELGTLKGKTLEEIKAKVGAPNSVSYKGTTKVCQWMQTGYHIVLIFDENDICQGVTHETSV